MALARPAYRPRDAERGVLHTCGVLAHGFARLRCDSCALERLVPFSCKGRAAAGACACWRRWRTRTRARRETRT